MHFLIRALEFKVISAFTCIFYMCVYIYFSLKMECEKLAQEKTEMQRHYVMVCN